MVKTMVTKAQRLGVWHTPRSGHLEPEPGDLQFGTLILFAAYGNSRKFYSFHAEVGHPMVLC